MEYSNDSDGDSEMDMLSVDLSPIKQNDQQHQRLVAVQTMSMMTPDMLETLGLTEVPPLVTKAATKPKKSVRINESINTARRLPPRGEESSSIVSSNCRMAVCGGGGGGSSSPYNCYDCDTSSNSSDDDSNSYGPISRAPDVADEDTLTWTLEEDDDETWNTYLQNYYYFKHQQRQQDWNVLECAETVLALPVACGLLCMDSFFGTNHFETTTRDCSTPSIILCKTTNNNKTSSFEPSTTTTSSNSNSNNNNDDDHEHTRSRCEVFPTVIGIPPNKIIAPCW